MEFVWKDILNAKTIRADELPIEKVIFNGQEFIAEYKGSIRFQDPFAFGVSTHDCHGNEVKIPTCDKCGASKSPLIGKEAMSWVINCKCEGENA